MTRILNVNRKSLASVWRLHVKDAQVYPRHCPRKWQVGVMVQMGMVGAQLSDGRLFTEGGAYRICQQSSCREPEREKEGVEPWMLA